MPTLMMAPHLNLERLARIGRIHPSWVEPLTPVQNELDALAEFLHSEEESDRGYLPSSQYVLRAFGIPFNKVRVVIVGQDPYPTPGHPIGLSFAVSPETKPIPRSLTNILKELSADLHSQISDPSILARWGDEGVMLLNRVLSVQPGKAGSHRQHGWEAVTECALRALDARPGTSLVAVLWGNDAKSVTAFMPRAHIISSAHPSPLSASRGFFGSRPFSRVNDYFVARGEPAINWLRQGA